MWRTLWNIFSAFAIFALLFAFLRWYIKGHFGKWSIFFWAYTILSIVMYINRPDHNPNWPQHDSRTGAEIWEENYGKSY